MSVRVTTSSSSSSRPQVRGMPSVRVESPVTVVIFGGTGDLTRRKLMPALHAMAGEHLLPDDFAVVGFGRRDYDSPSYRAWMREAVAEFSRHPMSDELDERFFGRLHYFKGELDDVESMKGLESFLKEARFPANRVFYLSTSPEYFGPVCEGLTRAGLVHRPSEPSWSRVVVEKPFGHDLASATALNQKMLGLLDESQVYRIDHFLGKETVQNILSFRFANAIFEPLFNANYVESVTVSASESVGMENQRGAYYDQSGALRDMLQNHLLQLLCLVAMEPPSGLSAEAVRNEKVKVLQSIRTPLVSEVPQIAVRGQYAAGPLGDRHVPAYVQEDRVPPSSRTETFAGVKLFVDNWRWAGVPFFIKTGKRLKDKATRITVRFKRPPLQLFHSVQCEGDVCDLSYARPNVLTFHIVPDPGISLNFAAKRPAMQLVVEDVRMDFRYGETWTTELPEAYERLLMDVMRGDSTLFTRSDEVEAAWRIVDPILKAWQADSHSALHLYPPGTDGPEAMRILTESH